MNRVPLEPEQEEIAARNAAAAEAARMAKLNEVPVDEDAQKQGAINSIAAIAVGGVALSVPFYWCALPAPPCGCWAPC